MRALRHLFAPSSARLFPDDVLERIAAATAVSESRHTGEICFAVEAALPLGLAISGHAARERAVEVFSRLRVWDTAANNGVLVYLLMADRAIEIVADRGVAACVEPDAWKSICAELEQALRESRVEAGVLQAIESISVLMEQHFARPDGYVDTNELPDRPHLM